MTYNRTIPDAPLPVSMLPRASEVSSQDLLLLIKPNNEPGDKTKALALDTLVNFLSLGTANLQDGSVTTEKLANAAVTTIKIETGAITTERLAYEAVTNQRLAANAVSTAKIVDSAVTSDKIGISAVTPEKLSTGAVTTDKISTGAVTIDKIGNGAVTAGKIANGAVTIDKIGNGAVTPEKISTGAVTSEKINTSAVTTAKLASEAVTTAKLASEAVTTAKLASEAVTKAKIAADVINLILDSWTISHRWPSSGPTMSATNFPFPRALVSSKLRITTLTNIWPTTEAVVQFTISMGTTEKIITNLTSGWSSPVNFVRYIDIDIDGASNLIGANYINVGAKENAGGTQLNMNFTIQSIPSV
jgi:hypothetical protein